jgi:hypothetical protein
MSQTCTTAEVISPRQDVIPNGRPLTARFLVAEHDDPEMSARIDVIRALNRHFERVFDPSRKDTRWGRRRLGIDDQVSRYGGTLAGTLRHEQNFITCVEKLA